MLSRSIKPLLLLMAIWSYLIAVGITADSTGPRIGARCRDGWRSSATGSGACSWHGGVARWIYAERDDPLEPLKWPLWIVGHLSVLALGAVYVLESRSRKSERVKQAELAASTSSRRRQTKGSDGTTAHVDFGVCERCGAPMMRRIRKRDGKPFLGCSKFPYCRNTREMPRENPEIE